MKRSVAAGIFVVLVFGGVMALANLHRPPADRSAATSDPLLSEYVVEHFVDDTGAANAVAAIYLNYRVYDTLFEALLLLIAIVAIMHFFRIGSRR